MPPLDIAKLVHDVGAQATIAIILVMVLARAVQMIVRRNEKDSDLIRESLRLERERADEERERVEDRDEDITKQSQKHWRLIGENAALAKSLSECQEKLDKAYQGGLTAEDRADLEHELKRCEEILKNCVGEMSVEEIQILRQMIVRLKEDNHQKDLVIYRLNEERDNLRDHPHDS